VKPRVAVIDDLESSREMMARALGPSFTATTYGSVAEALAAFEAEPPDVIVTDLRMPGIDGLDRKSVV
jgi:CheY-like chemotaxis protein